MGVRVSPLLAAAAAVAVAAGCSPRPPVAGLGQSESPAPSRAVTPTAPPSLAEQMRRWESVAGDHFSQSSRALEEISAATGADDESGVRNGCTVLHDTNAVGLQGHLPTPDPALTAELQRMIDDMNTAAHACLRFTGGRAEGDAETYRDYLARAVEHLHRAKAILDADLRGG